MFDACYSIVKKSKNLSINICQNLHRRKQDKKEKKVHHKRRERKKEEKNRLNKKKMPRNHSAKPVTNVRALQLFQETLTPRWLTTLLQIQNRHQPLTTAKPATYARAPPGNTGTQIVDVDDIPYAANAQYEKMFQELVTLNDMCNQACLGLDESIRLCQSIKV